MVNFSESLMKLTKLAEKGVVSIVEIKHGILPEIAYKNISNPKKADELFTLVFRNNEFYKTGSTDCLKNYATSSLSIADVCKINPKGVPVKPVQTKFFDTSVPGIEKISTYRPEFPPDLYKETLQTPNKELIGNPMLRSELNTIRIPYRSSGLSI